MLTNSNCDHDCNYFQYDYQLLTLSKQLFLKLLSNLESVFTISSNYFFLSMSSTRCNPATR